MSGEDSTSSAGLAAVGSAASALEGAGLEHWFFGGWAVDLWVGRVTRDHDDIDVMVWRDDESRVHDALTEAGWQHTPTPEDLLGTLYVRDGAELQLTFVVPGEAGGVVVPMPGQPMVLSEGPMPCVVRELDGASARVVPLALMLAGKAMPRPDEAGGAKDRADLAALQSVTDDNP